MTIILFLAWAGLSCSTSTLGPNTSGRFVTLAVYHTNDVHAHLHADAEGRGGIPLLAQMLKNIRHDNPEALIVDGGDFYKKGGLPAQRSGDQVTGELMGLIDEYDARCIGNNEIKVGVAKFKQMASRYEKAPLLSANFVDEKGEPVFKPYTILVKQGLKIGIIGLTVPISFSEEPHFKLLDVHERAQKYIKELRPQVDILIVLSHQNFPDNQKLAADFPEIDLVVSGHWHIVTKERIVSQGPLVVEAGEFARQVGFVQMTFDRETKRVVRRESTFINIDSQLVKPEPRVEAAVTRAYQDWAPDAHELLAHASDDFNLLSIKSAEVGALESELNDWVADGLKAVGRADMGMVNPVAVREKIFAGPITKEQIYLSLPYSDNVATVRVPVKKLQTMIEEAVVKARKKNGLFPFGFSEGVRVGVGSDHVTLKVAGHSSTVLLAIPAYVAKNCEDFFAKKFCPLDVVGSFGELRSSLVSWVKLSLTQKPPRLARVVRE